MLEDITLGANLSASLPVRRARRSDALQNDPHFLELAGRLLAQTAGEEAAARSSRSSALIHRVFSSGDEGAGQWSLYRRRIEAAIASGPVSFRELRELVDQAPGSASRGFQELSSIIREPDRDAFAACALSLAQRNLDRNELPQLTQALLAIASEHPATSGRARSILNVLSGGGSFAQQFQFLAPRLFDELSSPLALAPFALAGIGARAASIAVIGRSARYSWSTLVASEGAAWLVEVPTLVLGRRVGMQIFTDGNALANTGEIGTEMLAAAGPFLLLRAFGNAFEFATPALRRPFLNAEGVIHPLGAGVMHTARFGSEVMGMMAGHSLNGALDLGPRSHGLWQNFYQSVLATGHMRIAGHLIHRAGGGFLSETSSYFKSRLWQETRQSFHDRLGPWESLLGGETGWELGLALATGREGGPRRLFERNEVFMVGSGSGEGGEGGGSGPRESSLRFRVLRELLRQPLEDYALDVANHQKLRGRAAEKLNALLDRYSERPDLARDEDFARQLAEAHTELAEAQKIESKLQRSWRIIKALVRDYSEANPVAAESKEANQIVENLEKSQAEMKLEMEELGRLQRVLNAMGRFGNQDRLQVQLRKVLDGLNRFYQGFKQWSIPGFRRAGRVPNPLDAMHGALAGLASHGDGTESVLMNGLRGGPRPGSNLNLELEMLHQALYLTVQRGFKPEGLSDSIAELAGTYRASEKSSAAMLLASEFLLRSSRGSSEFSEFFAGLKENPAAVPLRDELRDLRSMLDEEIPLADGLSILSQEGNAPDYLISGLYLMLRSAGKTDRLTEDLRIARASATPGFHPSIPLSLYGAAHGREALPREFILDQEQLDLFLRNALPKEPAE